jgi:hypothetical protein
MPRAKREKKNDKRTFSFLVCRGWRPIGLNWLIRQRDSVVASMICHMLQLSSIDHIDCQTIHCSVVYCRHVGFTLGFTSSFVHLYRRNSDLSLVPLPRKPIAPSCRHVGAIHFSHQQCTGPTRVPANCPGTIPSAAANTRLVKRRLFRPPG